VLEIALIKKLLEMGETERAQKRKDWNGVWSSKAIDLNSWVPDEKYSTVIAKDTLHHVLELEHLFDSIHAALEDNGVSVTTDMIGRNGHMRWPETLELIQGILKFIPDHYKTNHLKRVEHEYVN